MTSFTSCHYSDNVVKRRGIGCDGGAGTQFGRENEPYIYVKQYSSGPDTKKKKNNRVTKITLSRFDQLFPQKKILLPDMTN